MMNDQEMQFADPEWRPRQNGSQAAVGPEPYSPQPSNVGLAGQPGQPQQPEWQEPAPERVYMAQEPPPYQFYQQPLPPPQIGIGGQYGQVRPRRRRRLWPWIIAAVILFAVIAGNMSHPYDGRGSFMNKSTQAQQMPSSPLQSFKVGSSPTIVINDAQGSTVHIKNGGNQPEVTVQTDGPGKAAVIPNDTANSLQIIEPDSASDITVTVPGNAKLVVTGAGSVNVEGVSGQMSLTATGDGIIDLQNVTLTGTSTIKTDSGAITFNGVLDASGSYQFVSTNGAINLTLPPSSAFHVNATTANGSISSDFPSVQSSSVGNGSQAQISVGNAPQARVTITTGSGDISLNSQ